MCSWLETGREVRPRRAREAFWRCEQALARRTSDIFLFLGGVEIGGVCRIACVREE